MLNSGLNNTSNGALPCCFLSACCTPVPLHPVLWYNMETIIRMYLLCSFSVAAAVWSGKWKVCSRTPDSTSVSNALPQVSMSASNIYFNNAFGFLPFRYCKNYFPPDFRSIHKEILAHLYGLLFKFKVVITLQRFVVFWNFPAVLPSKLAAGMA